jgi:hypothetical protein
MSQKQLVEDTMIPHTPANLTWETNCPPPPDEDDEDCFKGGCYVTYLENLTPEQKSMRSHASDYVDETPEVIDPETGYHIPRPLIRYRAYVPDSLDDDCLTEPRSPPSSEAVTPVFPKPILMVRTPAPCYNTTCFNVAPDQSPEDSSSSVVQKLDFSVCGWYET